MTNNCFGIPDNYRGFPIKQGPDDRFYVDAPQDGETWEELREEIDTWFSAMTTPALLAMRSAASVRNIPHTSDNSPALVVTSGVAKEPTP